MWALCRAYSCKICTCISNTVPITPGPPQAPYVLYGGTCDPSGLEKYAQVGELLREQERKTRVDGSQEQVKEETSSVQDKSEQAE